MHGNPTFASHRYLLNLPNQGFEELAPWIKSLSQCFQGLKFVQAVENMIHHMKGHELIIGVPIYVGIAS